MESRQSTVIRFWIGSAVCCFLLAVLGGLSLIFSTLPLTAVLSTVAFLLVFVGSGVAYLLRWRPVVKVMWIVVPLFFIGVFLYWWQTNQFIGVLPSLLLVLLIWQNQKLEKA